MLSVYYVLSVFVLKMTSLTNSANESILLEIFYSAANRGNIKT